MFERKKVGLALGAGGARGLAHIGVLKVLEKENIPIDFISGTSIGSLIAALYALEPNAKKLEKDAISRDIGKLFDYSMIPRCGLIKGDKIEKFLMEKIGRMKFSDLKIPLFVSSYDIENNCEVIFSRGDVAKAVRASISIPGFFIPVKNKNRILVDGAVADPVPTEILKHAGADIIIAVNVNSMKIKKPILNEEAMPYYENSTKDGLLKNVTKSLDVINSELARSDLAGDKIDLVIDVPLEKMGGFEFAKQKYAIAAGEKEAKKSLKKIFELTKSHPIKELLEDINKNLSIKKTTGILAETPALKEVVKKEQSS